MSERRSTKKLVMRGRRGRAEARGRRPRGGPTAVAFSETKRMGEGRKRPKELVRSFLVCLPQLI